MKPSRRSGAALFAATLLLSGVIAFTAGNAVQGSRIGEVLISQSVNDIKPSQCAGITLTGLVTGTLLVNGTDANELILGSAAIDTMDGGGGDDCIVGGALGDSLIGGPGNDVCIGGGGTDVLDLSCEVALQ